MCGYLQDVQTPNSRLGASCESEKPSVVEGGKEVVLFVRLHQPHVSQCFKENFLLSAEEIKTQRCLIRMGPSASL